MRIDGIKDKILTTRVKKKGQENKEISFGSFLDNVAENEASLQTNDINKTNFLNTIQAIDNNYYPDNSKAHERGDTMLNYLEEMRDNLALGLYDKSNIESLGELISKQKEELVDPNLITIIDEIELRVEVELAKFEKIRLK